MKKRSFKSQLLRINYIMNTIWFLMIVLSICSLIFINPSSVLGVMINASTEALTLSIELAAVYAIWMGILELVEASGLSQKLAKLLHPIIKWLFKIDDIETEKLIAMNMSANMLGLGNAATPMGIAAMKRLDDKSGIASPAVIMLIVLNSTSIQLLPSTVIGLRAAAGSVSPADIIIPTLIATICTFITGITLVKIFNHLRCRFSKNNGQAGKSKEESSTENDKIKENLSNFAKFNNKNLSKAPFSFKKHSPSSFWGGDKK